MDEQAQDESRNAFVLQLDGTGKTTLLGHLQALLKARDEADEENRWIVVRFSAWEYQRVAPPWWWLISALERQGKAALSRRDRWRFRAANIWWHIHLAKLDWMVAGLALVAVVAWLLLAVVHIPDGLPATVTKIAGLAGAAAAVVRAGLGIVRGQVLLSSPGGAAVLLRSSRDPLELVKLRYRFLVQTFRRPVAMFVDELDRCKGHYVVELLEGIRTLFVDDPALGTQKSRVGYVIAARDDWLCESYRQEYEAFAPRIVRPGRPFGRDFLDRAFDFTLVIPELAPALRRAYCRHALNGHHDATTGADDGARDAIDHAADEPALRRVLAETGEHLDGPLREAAIARLRHIRDDRGQRLEAFAPNLELRPEAARRLPVAYCFALATHILSGRVIEDDEHAIERLARWTVVTMEWPLLGAYLAAHPNDVERLGRDEMMGHGLPPEIEEVASLPEVRRVAFDGDGGLTADSVRRYVAAD
jgi:hypothetical protein